MALTGPQEIRQFCLSLSSISNNVFDNNLAKLQRTNLVFNEGNFAPCPIRQEINKYFRH